jgi:hypothetical protein
LGELGEFTSFLPTGRPRNIGCPRGSTPLPLPPGGERAAAGKERAGGNLANSPNSPNSPRRRRSRPLANRRARLNRGSVQPRGRLSSTKRPPQPPPPAARMSASTSVDEPGGGPVSSTRKRMVDLSAAGGALVAVGPVAADDRFRDADEVSENDFSREEQGRRLWQVHHNQPHDVSPGDREVFCAYHQARSCDLPGKEHCPFIHASTPEEMKECMYCCTDAKQPSAQGPPSKEASLACVQPSVTETYCQLITRVVVPYQALRISIPAIVLLATKKWRVAGVCNAEAKNGNGVIRVSMYGTGGVALAELELKSGVQPKLLLPNDRRMDLGIKTINGWHRLDAALFENQGADGSAAWLHQPFPPLLGELPSLMLEALARIAGVAGGVDRLLDSPLKLVSGVVTSGTISATVQQRCVCGRAKAHEGKRHCGDALGAVLEVRKGARGDVQLKVRCAHIDGCNTLLCTRALTEPVLELLERLLASATEHAACKALPLLASKGPAAAAEGRELLQLLSKPSFLQPPRWPPMAFADRAGRPATRELDECVSAAGIKRARSDLASLEPTTAAEKRRKRWLSDYLDGIDASYGAVDSDGLRWQRVPYRQRGDSKGQGVGRQEAFNVRALSRRAGGRERSRGMCLQAMMRELRAYGCAGVARDIDFKICQPFIFSQLPSLLTWADGRPPPELPEILALCAQGGQGRDELFKLLSPWHQLDTVQWDSSRKDMLKKLVTSLFFGGSYKAWIEETLLPPQEAANGEVLPPSRNPRSEHRHLRVERLETEMKTLQRAVFESEQWKPFVAEWQKLLQREKGGDAAAIDRSIMSRIAQELEDRCLRAVVSQLEEDGWQVLALVYDGCIVRERTGCTIDLTRLQNRVLEETKLRMVLEEKELFSAVPRLVLARGVD